MWQWGTESQENSSSSVSINFRIFLLDNFVKMVLRTVLVFTEYFDPSSITVSQILQDFRHLPLPSCGYSPPAEDSCPASRSAHTGLCPVPGASIACAVQMHPQTGRSGIPSPKNWIALQATLSFLGELAFSSSSGRTLHKTLNSWHFVVVVVGKELFLSILMIFSDFLWALYSWQLQISVYRQ